MWQLLGCDLEDELTPQARLSETWLDGSIADAEVEIAGFRLYRRDRGVRGGGVVVYMSEAVKSMRRQDLEEEGMEIVWIQIKMSKRSLLIGNVYRPPDAPAVWMDGLEAMLERVVQEKLDVVLLGDLNCNLLKPDHRAVRLGMVVSEYGFTEMVSGPTRVTQSSKTQIDLLFVTNPDVVKSCGCRELGLGAVIII